MTLPSASRLDTALTCLGSVVLPGVDEGGEYAEGGNVFHRFLDTARKAGKSAALVEAPEEERDWLAALDLDALPAGAESEVALGWSPIDDSAIRYTLAEHRGYPNDGLLHGTADLVGVVGPRAVVFDFKRYGAKVRAKDSAQLAILALAAGRLMGRDEAEVGMLTPTAKGWIVDRAYLDALDLEEWADRFRELVARIDGHRAGAIPPLAAGPHCTYCRVLRWCPAQSGIVRQVAGLELTTIEETVTALSDVEAGALYEKAVMVEKIAEAAKKALAARARQAPIPLSGGKVLREVRWSQQVKSEIAKAELAALAEQLEQRGEITKMPTTQVRAVRG